MFFNSFFAASVLPCKTKDLALATEFLLVSFKPLERFAINAVLAPSKSVLTLIFLFLAISEIASLIFFILVSDSVIKNLNILGSYEMLPLSKKALAVSEAYKACAMFNSIAALANSTMLTPDFFMVSNIFLLTANSKSKANFLKFVICSINVLKGDSLNL